MSASSTPAAATSPSVTGPRVRASEESAQEPDCPASTTATAVAAARRASREAPAEASGRSRPAHRRTSFRAGSSTSS